MSCHTTALDKHHQRSACLGVCVCSRLCVCLRGLQQNSQSHAYAPNQTMKRKSLCDQDRACLFRLPEKPCRTGCLAGPRCSLTTLTSIMITDVNYTVLGFPMNLGMCLLFGQAGSFHPCPSLPPPFRTQTEHCLGLWVNMKGQI